MRQHGDVTLGQEAALAMRFIRGDRYPDIPAAMSGARRVQFSDSHQLSGIG